MIITGIQYQHYKGGVYKVLMQAINEETSENMVIYSSLDDNTKWVRPISEFKEKFKPYLPLGSILYNGAVNYVVVHHDTNYIMAYCNKFNEMLKFKIVNVKPYYTSNNIMFTIKDIECNDVFNLTYTLEKGN